MPYVTNTVTRSGTESYTYYVTKSRSGIHWISTSNESPELMIYPPINSQNIAL